jgi:hypothetical protein
MRAKTLLGTAAALSALTATAAHRPAAAAAQGRRTARASAASRSHVRGVLHVHTGVSADARGDLETVARAARDAALDFVVLADHNSEASLGVDGYRHGVLVIGGLEKSTDAGHAIVLGLVELPFRLDGDPATVVRDAADLGAFVVVAHPFSSRPESSWSAGLDGVAAIECLNLAEPGAWPRGLGLLAPLLHYVIDPEAALLTHLRVSRQPLELWDRALQERPLAGLLGSDAHGGVRIGALWVPVPSYRAVFGLAQQHLLLRAPLSGDVPRDTALVLDAIRAGRGYLGLDSLADSSSFEFDGASGGRHATMGEPLPLDGVAELHAGAPAPPGTTFVLLRNGSEVARGPRLDLRTDAPGSYRVEARLDPALVPGHRELPWILSNPIDVYTPEELEARARLAARIPDVEPPAPERLEGLDDFNAAQLAPEWIVDRSDAWGRLSHESGTLRFDFGLGRGPHTHAAAMDWRERDLSPYRTLTFRVRADRRLRFDVQVRMAREAGAPGLRIWRRSVRAEREWRRATVALGELKTYDHEGGHPNLKAIRGISFYVDEATLPPGSSGTLWIDDVALGS